MTKKPELRGKAALIKLMHEAAHNHTLYDVFGDFCLMAATSFSNAVDLAQRDEREKMYAETAKSYDSETLALFPKMLSAVVEELEDGFTDCLGQTFMELEISNKRTGQFFTPYSLCQAIAMMQVDESLKEKIAKNGFVTVNEPAVGGGALIIAFAEALKNAGMNYQQHMHVVAQDCDPRSAHMAYIQLSLLHIPAVVIVGNTLAMEVRSQWFTPAHVLGNWSAKLRVRERQAEDATVLGEPQPPVVVMPTQAEQMSLFGGQL